MKPYSRADRVGTQLQRELSEALRKQVKDPRLAMATITAVKMSRDLKHARIYYISSGGQKSQEEVNAGFEQARGYLKRYLAHHLGMRYMPEIKFFYDDSFEYGSRIERLLGEIKKENG